MDSDFLRFLPLACDGILELDRSRGWVHCRSLELLPLWAHCRSLELRVLYSLYTLCKLSARPPRVQDGMYTVLLEYVRSVNRVRTSSV